MVSKMTDEIKLANYYKIKVGDSASISKLISSQDVYDSRVGIPVEGSRKVS